MLTGWKRVLLLIFCYVGYLLIGAAVFHVLEHGEEGKTKTETYRQKLAFLKNYTCLTEEAVERFIEVMIDALQNGINPSGTNTTTSHSNWDFTSAFFFVGTVVSTIGYGNRAPTTESGQIFCVFFALFGIPMNLIILNNVGKHLSSLATKLGKRLLAKGMKKKKVKILTILISFMAGVIVFLLLPPVLFLFSENWSYMEGVYFSFITLSTIGFGDYVVGMNTEKKYSKIYKPMIAIWILFGMAWLALLFNLLTEFFKGTEKKLSKAHQKKKATKANKTAMNGSESADILSSDKYALSDETDTQQESVTTSLYDYSCKEEVNETSI
ncbi:potassium channel subfamily K member 16-like [Protopterus annectens]|uniref:potassium channel subfamily K member 16-like n=1 Tax=Protopterus annectens TaxID=7888 RepID=UPI001CFA5712|nr:potassium channel subfamily K member 16-like [Protopterus annectens]